MSTFCDVGGGFFFARLFPRCVGIRNGVEGGEAPPSKTTTEDAVICCQLPPPCEWFVFSLPHDPHQKMQPLGQGSETTVSPKPSREAPGSEEGERSESLFRFRENPRELKIKPIFISIRLPRRFVFCDFFFLFISVNNVVAIIQFFNIYILLNSYDVEIDIIRSC